MRKAENLILVIQYSRCKFTSKRGDLMSWDVMGCCGSREAVTPSIPTLVLRVASCGTVQYAHQLNHGDPSVRGMDDRGRRERSQSPPELFVVCIF
jgi:hypothetical protein